MSKGESTRLTIIKKSAELFNLYGYNGCSLSDIMKATNLKKGGIYNHFRNKDEIAVAAFEYSYKKVIERFRSRLDHDRTSTQKLYSIIEVFGSFAEDPVISSGCPIFNTAVDALDAHPVLRRQAKLGFERLEKYIEIKVTEGVENGEFRPGSQPKEVSALFLMTLEGAIMMAQINRKQNYMDVAMKHLQEYIKKELLLISEVA